ncbi:MAG: porin [Sulfuricurvum sp.]|uniref:OmpP1/FadL family transporter n=1 Tax=Sulfuricurvum sp. TaxID=2025608 RepID=UPI002736EF9F|nr:outer membrane protein transport protein [Sulfuricurvum sp.]MDP2851280.1 porin [Sulfuricurvum sp.]
MKRSIKIAVAAALALSGTSAFATNGDHLIGMGAKARGMGGIGIGMSHGAESALANPALISSVKGTEISFGGTIFMPDVQTTVGEGYKDSSADLSVIPEVAVAQKVSDNFTWGIGMFGTAGMGVDHRAETGGAFNNYKMVTNLQLMQFAVPLAYTIDSLSVGIAPVVQYGSLDINYLTPALAQSTTQGVAQDFGMGYNLGVSYEMSGLTVGASYKSAIDMLYKGQLSKATVQFGMNGGAGLADNLEQPAEIGIGASYTTNGHTVALDYKKIKWESAKGYKDFGWEDQNVYIIGYQYAQDNWALRAGYNYAKSPIKEQVGTDAAQKNLFNLLGFPGIVEKHYTVGGTYAFTKMTSLDLAYVYAAENTETFTATGMTANNQVSTKHSQDAVSFQLNFAF